MTEATTAAAKVAACSIRDGAARGAPVGHHPRGRRRAPLDRLRQLSETWLVTAITADGLPEREKAQAPSHDLAGAPRDEQRPRERATVFGAPSDRACR